jgi:hypothetical protein
VHHANARRGSFLSGGYLKLPLETSRLITKEDVLAGNATDYTWLRAHGTRRSRRLSRMRWGPLTSVLLDMITTTAPTFNGHNSSVWRDDLVAVNGFDERLEYGGLDRELGERLEHAGVRGRQLRHRALVVHLDHPRGYRNAEAMAKNRAIRDEVARLKLHRTPYGLDRHLGSGADGAVRATGKDGAPRVTGTPAH